VFFVMVYYTMVVSMYAVISWLVAVTFFAYLSDVISAWCLGRLCVVVTSLRNVQATLKA
jgi:hypothetical protein